MKARAGLVGAIAVVVLLALQSIEHWTVVDSVLTGLRNEGAGGRFLADILTSRALALALAIAAIYLSIEGRKKEGVGAVSLPPIATRSESNPTQTQTGIRLEQHFHHPDSETTPPKLATSPEERKRPNIRCLGPLTTRLRMGMDGHGFYEDAEDHFQESHPAALVCFRNEASIGRQVQVVFNARASIGFYDDAEEEMGTGIAEACWRGDLRNINFSLEETQCVIVAILLNGAFACPYVRIVPSHWGEGLLTEIERLNAHPKTIEVRLVKESELLLPPCVFDFSVEGDRPVLRQRPALGKGGP